MLASWLRKTTLIALVFISAWFSVKLFLLTTSYREEVYSMKQFNFKINEVQARNDTLMVTLKFRNPSPKNIQISFISCEVRFNGDLVGVYSSDLRHSPIVIGNFSEHSREVPMTNKRFLREYTSKEIDLQVYARVKIGIDYLSGVAIEDTYTAKIILQ